MVRPCTLTRRIGYGKGAIASFPPVPGGDVQPSPVTKIAPGTRLSFDPWPRCRTKLLLSTNRAGPRSVLASSSPQALARALDLLPGRPHPVGMLSPSTSPGARLLAPWFKLWNEIRYSIGEDPNVQIDPLNTNSSPYLISIHVSDSTKASALASILLPTYSFGNVTVNVQVDNSGTVVQPSALATNQDVKSRRQQGSGDKHPFCGSISNSRRPYWRAFR